MILSENRRSWARSASGGSAPGTEEGARTRPSGLGRGDAMRPSRCRPIKRIGAPSVRPLGKQRGVSQGPFRPGTGQKQEDRAESEDDERQRPQETGACPQGQACQPVLSACWQVCRQQNKYRKCDGAIKAHAKHCYKKHIACSPQLHSAATSRPDCGTVLRFPPVNCHV